MINKRDDRSCAVLCGTGTGSFEPVDMTYLLDNKLNYLV